jgi:hypothetical protein
MASRMAIPLNYSQKSPQSRLEQMPHDRIGPANNSHVSSYTFCLFVNHVGQKSHSPASGTHAQRGMKLAKGSKN